MDSDRPVVGKEASVRKAIRAFSELGPEQRVGEAIATLPSAARRALQAVADREDLPLVAGSWQDGTAGCLVANVLRAVAATRAESAADDATLDIRMLEQFPELSSRDLNRLIVAWDEAALQEGRSGDAALRRLLHGALARADQVAPLPPLPAPARDAVATAAADSGLLQA